MFWRNPLEFYGQSGRLTSQAAPVAPAARDFAGNSIRRGEALPS